MKYLISIFIIGFIAGCATVPKITYKNVTVYANHTNTVDIAMEAPVNAKGFSGIDLPFEGGMRATLSPAQSKAGILKAKGNARNKWLLYLGCMLVIIIGAVALALPNKFVSNKDALMVMGAGGALIAVVTWVDASAGIMAWVIPALIVGASVYIGWLYWRGKKDLNKTDRESPVPRDEHERLVKKALKMNPVSLDNQESK